MALVKLGLASAIPERIVKEAYERTIVLHKAGDEGFLCLEVPDAHVAALSTDQLAAHAGVKKLSVYKDSDGMLWVNLPERVAPVVDTASCKFPAGAPAAPLAECPPPLVPFAGCDRKPMAPSPAKPFAPQPSPLKPSPLKERVDAATEAVARKTWTGRQARMGEFFGPARKRVIAGAATAGVDSPTAADA